MKLLDILVLAWVVCAGCHAPAVTTPSNEESVPSTRTAAVVPVAPLPKNADASVITHLPPQFMVEASWVSPPQTTAELTIISRIAGNIEIRVYRTEALVQFFSAFNGLTDVELPAEIVHSLAHAKNQIQDDWHEIAASITPSEFTLIHREHSTLAGRDGNWQERKLSLPPLLPGCYLVETQLGPQVAHLPIMISSMTALTFPVEQKQAVWLLDSASGQPCANRAIFYRQGQQDWQRCVTDERGFAIADWLPTLPGWLLLTDASHVYALPLPANHMSEPITATDEPEMKTAPTPPQQCLWFPRHNRIFPCDSQVEVTLWSALRSPEQELTLSRREEDGQLSAVARQTRLCQKGQAKFFFEVRTPGSYQLSSQESKAEFYVYDLSQPVSSSLIDSHYGQTGTESTQVLVPGKRQGQMLAWAKQGKIKTCRYLEAFTGNRLVTFPREPREGACQFHTCYREDGQWVRESWELPPGPSALLAQDVFPADKDITVPLATATEQPVLFQKNLQLRPGVPALASFARTVLLPDKVTAKAITVPVLYQSWLKYRVLEEYAQAVLAYQQEHYSEAYQYCSRILQRAPGHPDTMALLASTLEKISSGESSPAADTVHEISSHEDRDIRLRLEQKIFLPQTAMPLSHLIDNISEQTGVYCEFAPKLPYVAQGLENLPRVAEAQSLLNYALAPLHLVYKIEQGMVYITETQDSLNKGFLDKLDTELASQLPASECITPVPYKDKAEADSAPSVFVEVATSMPSLKFSQTGIWTLRAVTSDSPGKSSTMWQPVLIVP